jgi:hypothetical protein
MVRFLIIFGTLPSKKDINGKGSRPEEALAGTYDAAFK